MISITYKKLLIIAAAIILIADAVFLYTKYQASLQPTFSEDVLKEHPLLKKSVDETVKTIQEKAKSLPANSFSMGASKGSAEIFEAFFQDIKTADLFRIKVWDKNFTVVWSNSEELAGKTFTDNHEVEEALAGEVEVEVKKGKPEHYTERSFTNYIEVYVPIVDSQGKVIGVVETYRVIENVVSDLRQEFYKSAALILGASGAVFAFLAFVLKLVVKK